MDKIKNFTGQEDQKISITKELESNNEALKEEINELKNQKPKLLTETKYKKEKRT